MRKRMPRTKGNHWRQALKTVKTLLSLQFRMAQANDENQTRTGYFQMRKIHKYSETNENGTATPGASDDRLLGDRRQRTNLSSPRGFSANLVLPRAQDCPS